MGNLFSKFFGTVGVIDSIRVTLVMSFWSTLIASMLGIFLGLVLEQTKFPGKKLVVRVNRTLMGAPPVVIGLLTYMPVSYTHLDVYKRQVPAAVSFS